MTFANTVPVRAYDRIAAVVRSTPFLLILFAAGCSGVSGTTQDGPDVISVEGRVTYYGNVPFEEAALVTDDGNWYVLELTDDQRSDLVTPTRQRVRGRVYLDDWNGRPFAWLDVREIERINR